MAAAPADLDQLRCLLSSSENSTFNTESFLSPSMTRSQSRTGSFGFSRSSKLSMILYLSLSTFFKVITIS